ncbi:hypothetical protein DKX38_004831 [Salix brachista]|uniref:Uncharacterized protein n=1 Tax=Salix brachista TaxID=2182728 RepID=A0A5N5NCR1_9ROSI|nr:hypothetical protein DKX38_004831 [Salix brachista]
MENSFRDRVDKIFGSLTPSSSSKKQPSSSKPQPSSSLQSDLWSLTGDAIERKEWKSDTSSLSASFDRDEIPCASSFDKLKKERTKKNFEHDDDMDELNDDEDDGELNRSEDGLEDWDIRSSIGLDPTLDNEEEEDEYDKVAEGRENAGERLYMKDVTDQGSYLNFNNVISKSLHDNRDPRANHLAAKIRLQEDQVEVQTLNSQSVCDKAIECQAKASSECDDGQLKSILKRKQNNSDFKSCKRVRFEPGCGTVHEEEASVEIQDISISTSSANDLASEDGSFTIQNAPGVPDYLRNPSKYTRYSFDSSTEVEEKSNQAYMDFLKLVKHSKSTESELEEASSDLPKSVTFIPKKKSDEIKAVTSGSMVKQDKGHHTDHHAYAPNFPIGIASGESQDSEAGAMEENEPERNVLDRNNSFRKPARRYRTKSSMDDFDP